jgi:Kef-type K+ transport system membrane component KefB
MTLLLLQITVVLVVTLLCGSIACRLGQTRVIGEIIGGILLGPSVLFRLSPHIAATLFPANTLAPLEVLSTVGLILFLFLIGTQLDLDHLHRQKAAATLASLTSIVLPFLFAIIIAPPLRNLFAPADVSLLAFTLFLGVSMSITAFPVLARILEERGLHTTTLGTTALLCAAVDDVCAWTLLAAALTLVPGAAPSLSLPLRLALLLLYITTMVGIVRPLARRVAHRHRAAKLSPTLFGVVLALVFASAAATDALGVHPLFGAFLAGICLPRIPEWQIALRNRLDIIVSVLLLPFFFALTGMRTRLDLLATSTLWLWAAVLLFAAIAGKMGGAILAARFTGESWTNAFALGALLNTRGLVELIVLNIAYNAHVFSAELFSMLVLMAILTTMMTTPILNLLGVGKGAELAQPNPR